MPRVYAHFFVCTNERPDGHPLPSCGPRGGLGVFEAFTQELARRGFPAGVKVTATGCLTPCQYGPNVVVYPEGSGTPGSRPAMCARLWKRIWTEQKQWNGFGCRKRCR